MTPLMDLRTIGTGAQVLRALGVRKMRVLGAPKLMHGLSGFGLEVVEYIDSECGRSKDRDGRENQADRG
jgi:GTP cyclohydrolase II